MNKRKKPKKQLGDKYIFRMYLSVNQVKKLISENPKDKNDTLFASLTVGCVKINSVVFPTPDKMLLGFDILVKDTPENEEGEPTLLIFYSVKAKKSSVQARSMNGLTDRRR